LAQEVKAQGPLGEPSFLFTCWTFEVLSRAMTGTSAPESQNPEVNESTTLLPQKRVPCPGTASSLQLVLNIIVGGLGTGIFTLPWSTAGASCITALVIIAAVLALNAWTIGILVEAAEIHQAFDLGTLLSAMPGNLGFFSQLGTNAAIWMGTFLCLVSYMIVVADCATSFLGPERDDGFLRQRLVCLASCLALPLCFLDQRWLSVTSSLSVGAVIFIFAVMSQGLIAEEAAGLAPRICLLGLSSGSVAMVAAMMQTVVIQMCILPMYAEMQDRSPGRFKQVVAVSFLGLFVLCASFSILGYVSYGSPVTSNVLVDLPSTSLGHAARACAAVSVMGVYPIFVKPMIASMSSHINGSIWQERLCTVGIVFLVMVSACFLRDLGKLNLVNGALSMGVFVAVVPFLIGKYLLDEPPNGFSWNVAMYSLLIVGTASTIVSCVMVDNYVDDLAPACIWMSGGA